MPVAARLSELNGIRNRPPIGAIVLRYSKPFTVTTTGGRLPAPKDSTTSGGTSIPVLLPDRDIVVSNRMQASLPPRARSWEYRSASLRMVPA